MTEPHLYDRTLLERLERLEQRIVDLERLLKQRGLLPPGQPSPYSCGT